MSNPIDSPSLGSNDDDLVDWLELTALFDEYGVARLDSLLGALVEQCEVAEDNIGERDQQLERLIERLENEVEFRQRSLGEAYPFKLTDSCEELYIGDGWRDPKFSFYFICLITTHVTGSTILRKPPVEDLLIRLRNRVFQIVATLGLAGLSRGPAFSVGWPRQNGEVIVQLLARAAGAGGGFSVRNPPSPYVSPHEKDGGVDVIAWTKEGRPPPSVFYFGQTASGKNWPNKPVIQHAKVFRQAYMLDHMTGNLNYVTLIPYRVFDNTLWNLQNQFHGAILDRLGLPLRALEGLNLAKQGVPIDGADNLEVLTQWLSDFISYAQAA